MATDSHGDADGIPGKVGIKEPSKGEKKVRDFSFTSFHPC